MQKQSEHVTHATDRIRPKTSRIRGACGIRHPHVLLLGFAQMFGAVFSVTLLIRSGVTRLALAAVAITGLLTTISMLLFGARHVKRASSIR